MTTLTPIEVSECTLCQKPLGQESRDLGYILCHDCRLCNDCKLPVSPQEITYCNSHSLVVTHARCLIYRDRALKDTVAVEVNESLIERNNLARLILQPDMNLSVETNQSNAIINNKRFVCNMNFEELYVHVQVLMALAADCSLMLKQDKGKTVADIKKDLDRKEARKFREATIEAKTSSKPVGKRVQAEGEEVKGLDEIRLAWYMEKFGVTDRKTAIRNSKLRDKAIEGMQKATGLSLEKCTTLVDSE